MTKVSEPKAVEEVHAIRERLFEEERGASAAERRERCRSAARPIIEQLGLRVVHVQPRLRDEDEFQQHHEARPGA